jgi:hypothetical protein
VRIGLDFDNTLIDYDAAFVAEAIRQGVIAPGQASTKTEVKQAVIGSGAAGTVAGDETAWMRLQGQVYGRGIGDGRLIDGVARFLETAISHLATVFIVSHKTQLGHFDESRTDLREAARGWMWSQGFFDRLGLAEDRVFFAETLDEKVGRIASLDLDVYIDDLPKVLAHPDWPSATRRIHYLPQPGSSPEGVTVCRTWSEIHDVVFGG